jgi:hypothetical protein
MEVTYLSKRAVSPYVVAWIERTVSISPRGSNQERCDRVIFGSRWREVITLVSGVFHYNGSAFLLTIQQHHKYTNSTIGTTRPSMSSTANSTPSTGVKSCSKCKTDKPLDEFQIKVPGNHGSMTRSANDCKECRVCSSTLKYLCPVLK